MRITSLQTQATNAERINIFVDGHFLMGANALIVLQMGLKVGQELTDVQLEQLRNEEVLQKAVDRALNYLSFRPRSRQELRNYLRRKETPPELIETVLARSSVIVTVIPGITARPPSGAEIRSSAHADRTDDGPAGPWIPGAP